MGQYIKPIDADYLKLSGGTVTGSTYFTENLSATTFYGDGSNLTGIHDYYVTGGTNSGYSVILSRNDGVNISFNLDSFVVKLSGDTYTTGGTFTNNSLSFYTSGGISYSVPIEYFTGLTIEHLLTAEAIYGTSISGETLYSGSTNLYDIFQTIGSDLPSTLIQNGLNTYTGGTTANPTVNISAATLNNLTVSGNTLLNVVSATSVSATTFFGDGSNIYNIITGATNVGSGSSIFNSINNKNILFNSITGGTNNKINTTLNNDTINIDIDETKLSLWPLVVNGNTLISGGASLISGLTFSITPLTYIIGSIIYNITGTTELTLLSGDSIDNRIDVIVADISGNTSYVSGISSQNPVKPEIDPSTQIEVTFVTVLANSTGTTVTETLVYDENVGIPSEWNFITNSNTITGNSTTSVYHGSKSIEFSGTPTVKYFEMSAATPFNTVTQNVIQFAIKNKISWPSGNRLRLSFRSASDVQIGGIVDLYNARFGFSSTNVTSWQVIAIPLSYFNLTTSVISKFRVLTVSTGSNKTNLFIDYIRFQEGVPTITPVNQWLKVQADDLTSVQATTPSDTLIISGGSNIKTTTNGVKSLIVNLDDDIRLLSVSATSISATTFYGDGSQLSGISTDNFYTTGATLSASTAVFNRNDGVNYNLDLSPLKTTTLSFSAITETPSTLFGYGITDAFSNSGGTINGSVSATTFYGDGSNLSGINSTNTFTTGATLSGYTSVFSRNDGVEYNLDLTVLKTTTLPFSAITSAPTTLSGYGIIDTYTAGQTNSLLNDKYDKTGGTINGNVLVTGTTTINSLITTASTTTIVETTSGGTLQSSNKFFISAYITDGAAISNLNNVSNWNIDGVYTGTTITNTYAGQKHYNSEYFFEAVQDNLFIRLIRG